MKSKKALTRGEFIIMIVLVVVSALIVYFAVFAPTAKAVPSAFGDEMCLINAGVRAWPWAGKIVIPLAFCGERRADIYADDWSKCKQQYKEDFDTAKQAKDEYTQELSLRNCAAEQIADLTMRCWNMYGEGGWNLLDAPSKYDCYRFYVYNMGEDNQISQDDVKNHIDDSYLDRDRVNWEKSNGYCKISRQEEIEIKFDDRMGLTEDKVMIVGIC